MNTLTEGSVVTLNNNKDYIIVNIIEYNNFTYLNLISTGNEKEILIVKAEDKYGITILSEIDNKEELSSILDIIEKQ